MKKLQISMKKIYPLVRNLHLYFGLFISPFILIYGLSALAFNHEGWLIKIAPVKLLPGIRTKLDKIPYDSSDLSTAKAIIQKLGIEGEVDFISKGEDFISFPVNKPGLKSLARINTRNDSVYITKEKQGFIRAMSFLHKMPGPHNEKIRGNAVFMKFWRFQTNILIYFLLFLSISGVFLWYFIKIERNMGLFAIALGIVSFTGLLLLLF
jgi:hypothetical protein